ncbi:putative epoxide hydrolase [Pseudomassariella vexata]|uniref:Putative epoxide hydrolase n=1 Tax=Pseudomassariella vexata TaxID=1141098 RepID=A0A1Y2E9K5_9PEZI|nr:putative epoxide hydrolase [Pseudomassariella vexata]ORY68268.1 putative epoxide hydrolase [Pseudomassariella vexata]
MASIAFPSIAKTASLSDDTTYGYVAIASASPEKPTFLLLHGYPSSSFDWRHQIKSLSVAGYGVIVPDLLGYGDTDKPEDVASYRLKSMSLHMAEILDIEGVPRCIAVGHDWGCGLLSRLATYIPERLFGIVPISVSYIETGVVWDIDAFNKFTEQLFGYSTYGYWPWHNTEEAVKDCNENPASTFSLIYPADPADWKVIFAPVGAAKEYVRAGRVGPLPSWYSLSEYTTRDRILANGGYRGPLSWYKAAMRDVNAKDEQALSKEDGFCKLPTLLIVSDEDYVTRADMQIQKSKEWVPDLRIQILHCGHWIQLQKPEEVHRLLVEFAAEVTGTESVSNGHPATQSAVISVKPET